jgi:hypothetical protein
MQRARTALLLMNCVAIVGYAAFPLMPPRLVPDCDTQFGGCDADYTFVDTMDTLGGIWSWRGSALAGVRRSEFDVSVRIEGVLFYLWTPWAASGPGAAAHWGVVQMMSS